MSVILFDLVSAQVDKGVPFNGGSEFLKSLCRAVLEAKANNTIHLLLSRSKFLDENFELYLKKAVPGDQWHFIEDVSHHPDFWKITGVNTFFIGILQRYARQTKFLQTIPTDVKLIATIHDIVEFITSWSWERMLFERYSNPKAFISTIIRGPGRLKTSRKTLLDCFNYLKGRENTYWWTDSEYSKATIIYHLNCDPNRITTLWPAPSPNQEYCSHLDLTPTKKVAPYVLLAGDRWSKNLLCAIRAGKMLNQNGHPFHLKVFGNFEKMPIRNLLRQLPWITTSAYGSQVEMIQAVSNSRGLLFPTWCEGFGYPPLEACLLGRPIIASSATCVPEILGEAGFYHSPSNPLQLAHQIISLEADSTNRTDPTYLQSIGKKRIYRQLKDLEHACATILGQTLSK